jgi:hypothetical protein
MQQLVLTFRWINGKEFCNGKIWKKQNTYDTMCYNKHFDYGILYATQSLLNKQMYISTNCNVVDNKIKLQDNFIQ